MLYLIIEGVLPLKRNASCMQKQTLLAILCCTFSVVGIFMLYVFSCWQFDVVCFQLLPDSASFTMGINEQEATSQMEHDGVIFPQADCKDSALTAMDGSLDGGYTISVKTEDQKPDLFKEETLQTIEPRHWTVNDRGVLVNADESEVTVKLEKPDWTIENVIADCSTIISVQDASDTKDGILTVKEEDAHVQPIER